MSDYDFDEMTATEVDQLFDEMTTSELMDFFGEKTTSNLQILRRYDNKLFVVDGNDLDYNPEDENWATNHNVFVGRERARIGEVVDFKTLSREQIMDCLKEAYEENLI
jgi:hypothetical protein